jgi:hypothetical protein
VPGGGKYVFGLCTSAALSSHTADVPELAVSRRCSHIGLCGYIIFKAESAPAAAAAGTVMSYECNPLSEVNPAAAAAAAAAAGAGNRRGGRAVNSSQQQCVI